MMGGSAAADVRLRELPLEQEVSTIIRAMPFVWLAIADTPGPSSVRGYIEGNSIALLSNLHKQPIDPPSTGWRGGRCTHGPALVRDSGLWNQRHVAEAYDPKFLEVFDDLVVQGPPAETGHRRA